MAGAGFFHRDLAASFDGRDARGWLDHDVVAHQADIAAAFAEPQRVPHVMFDGALAATRADALHHALERARFVRHHHGAYPLHIAPRAEQGGVLADFMDWLAAPATQRLHMTLVGLRPDRRIVQTQVQVSRMEAGESFPPHVDTGAPALAVIYNLTRGFDDDDGGALHFIDARGAADIVVPPLWNSACLFYSTNALHAVSPVTKRGGRRYSATVFTVWAP